MVGSPARRWTLARVTALGGAGPTRSDMPTQAGAKLVAMLGHCKRPGAARDLTPQAIVADGLDVRTRRPTTT